MKRRLIVVAAISAALVMTVAAPAFAATYQYANTVSKTAYNPVTSVQATHTGGRADILVNSDAYWQHIRTI